MTRAKPLLLVVLLVAAAVCAMATAKSSTTGTAGEGLLSKHSPAETREALGGVGEVDAQSKPRGARPFGNRRPGLRAPSSYWRLERRYVRLQHEAGRLGAEVRRLRRDREVRTLQAVHAGTGSSGYAIRLASSTFGVSVSEMTAVARCETADFTDFYNDASGASGLFQFLGGTWASQGLRGFSVFDQVANALAAARIVAREGWGQWSCSPR